jgi:hypothetical protein
MESGVRKSARLWECGWRKRYNEIQTAGTGEETGKVNPVVGLAREARSAICERQDDCFP